MTQIPKYPFGTRLVDDVGNPLNLVFGEPTLHSQGNGSAVWAKGKRTSTIPSDQKSTTGWLAKLTGGIQSSWDDAGSMWIPVNELPLIDFFTASWSYWMAAAELFGCQIAFWVHDPTNHKKRADIIQSGAATALGKASGWNEHTLDFTSATPGQFFWYGENVTSSASVAPGLTTGSTNLYTLAQFQADAVFKNWTIYRISLSNGFYSAGYFGDMYVADVKFNGHIIQLKPSVEEQLDIMRDDQAKAQRTIPTWTFGEPVLRMGGNGRVGWVKDTGNTEALNQKSTSGYLANLYGGLQTGGASWGAVYIPVNELSVPDLKSALWTYCMADTEVYGVNMVIWVHDPTDNDKRAEITQGGSVAGLAHNDGWNAHELDSSVSQFFAFGEGTTGTALSGLNSWAAYQADILFATWTIYRISFEMGWYSTGTFTDVWVADVKLNGQVIPLMPRAGEVIGRETKSIYIATDTTSTTRVTAITPAATKRVRILNVFASTANASAALFEVYFHTGANIATTATKAIFAAELDLGVNDWAGASYGDNGLLGDIGEVVSIRADADIDTDGKFVIVYREE